MSEMRQAKVVTCCGHLDSQHGEDGCEVGWNYDTAGVSRSDGCPCEMRGPR